MFGWLKGKKKGSPHSDAVPASECCVRACDSRRHACALRESLGFPFLEAWRACRDERRGAMAARARAQALQPCTRSRARRSRASSRGRPLPRRSPQTSGSCCAPQCATFRTPTKCGRHARAVLAGLGAGFGGAGLFRRSRLPYGHRAGLLWRRGRVLCQRSGRRRAGRGGRRGRVAGERGEPSRCAISQQGRSRQEAPSSPQRGRPGPHTTARGSCDDDARRQLERGGGIRGRKGL